MVKLIGVAIVSAVIGAGLTFWAKSTVLPSSAHADPTTLSSGALISPHDIMRASKNLPAEAFKDPF